MLPNGLAILRCAFVRLLAVYWMLYLCLCMHIYYNLVISFLSFLFQSQSWFIVCALPFSLAISLSAIIYPIVVHIVLCDCRCLRWGCNLEICKYMYISFHPFTDLSTITIIAIVCVLPPGLFHECPYMVVALYVNVPDLDFIWKFPADTFLPGVHTVNWYLCCLYFGNTFFVILNMFVVVLFL